MLCIIYDQFQAKIMCINAFIEHSASSFTGTAQGVGGGGLFPTLGSVARLYARMNSFLPTLVFFKAEEF